MEIRKYVCKENTRCPSFEWAGNVLASAISNNNVRARRCSFLIMLTALFYKPEMEFWKKQQSK